MSEPFISFAQSFRIFFSSVLALASSGNVILVYLITKDKIVLTSLTKSFAFVGFMCFTLSILILVLLSYISMRSEVKEGMSSEIPDQREINLTKFDQCEYVLLSFGTGLLMLILVFAVVLW